MIEPKFKVGDVVFWRAHVVSWEQRIKPSLLRAFGAGYVSIGETSLMLQSPEPMVIVEVLTQQCYGGTQVLYTFRRPDASTFNLTEAELVADYERVPVPDRKEG